MSVGDLAKVEGREDLTADQQLKVAEVKALLSISQNVVSDPPSRHQS